MFSIVTQNWTLLDFEGKVLHDFSPHTSRDSTARGARSARAMRRQGYDLPGTTKWLPTAPVIVWGRDSASELTTMKAPVSSKKRARSKSAVETSGASLAAREARKRAAAPAPAPRPVRRRRRSGRSEATIAAILAAAENVVLRSGVHRVAILNVCKAAGISRGTFYRYFSAQDELLDALVRHKREGFHRGLIQAMRAFSDPDKRFDAFIEHLETYLEHTQARQLLIVSPEFALGFFHRFFHDAVVRFQDVLEIVFDAWEVRLDAKLDRELICELLIRYVLSEHLAPSGNDGRALPSRIRRLIATLTAGAGAPALRT
jgi:AcrR family transcriptional regulator